MRFDNDSVRNGMFVMGTQGERIGKVILCNEETFVVEKGVFFPKDYELRYDHITDVTGGTIRYALTDFLRGRAPEEAKLASASPTLAGAASAVATTGTPIAAASTAVLPNASGSVEAITATEARESAAGTSSL